MQRPALAFTLFSALTLCSAGGHGAPQAPDSGPAPDTRVSERAQPCVRLRSGAALDRSVVDCLEPGTRLRALGSIGGWSHVRLLDGTEGWVDSSFLEPAPALPASEAPAPPAAAAEPADEIQDQIAALEGQLQAISAHREATEERLRQTVAAAEAAQSEASQLRERVLQLESEAARRDGSEQCGAEIAALQTRIMELEKALAASESRLLRAAGLNADQERRIEALDAALTAGRAREAEHQQALAAAQERANAAEQLSAEMEARTAQLEAEPPPDSPRKAELKRRLKELRAQLRTAEEANTQQASRLAELEADLPAARGRETELGQALAAAEERLRTAERLSEERAQLIADLKGRLAGADVRVAEADLGARVIDRPEPAPQQPTETLIKVRPPIVGTPEPPKVSVRMPAAMGDVRVEAPPEPPAEDPVPSTEAAIEAIQAWAAAWSDQRVDDYLSFYAAGFQPPNGLSRPAWEAQRRQRLSRPSYVRVTISSLNAEQADDGSVTATFQQDYESNTFADTVTKVLTLVEEEGTWRLLLERATP